MVHVPPHVAVERRSPTLTPALGTRLLLGALRVASAATGGVPRYPHGEAICRVAGAAWYVGAPAARAAVRDNLRHVLGRRPARAEIIRVFHHGALNYWDTFAIPRFSPAQLLALVDLHGAEHVDSARAAGRGVICASAHLGSVAFVGQVLPCLGYPTVGLLEPLEPPELYEFFARQRQAHGSRLLPAGPSAVRELLAALRRNEVLGLVTDRDISGTGPIIPFIGAATRFPDGAAALSVRTGAPILIAVAVRKAGGRFDGWIEPLPAVERTGDTKRDVLELTRAVAGRLGYYVASHPEQWTVFQRRWPEAQPG
jgi:phosphatidylinositol dimannoside acyltransferase